ncbi:hypothetical protein AB4304_13955 [Vibrio breoganii]
MPLYAETEVNVDITKLVSEVVLCPDDLITILENVDDDMISEFAQSWLSLDEPIDEEQLKSKLRELTLPELLDYVTE